MIDDGDILPLSNCCNALIYWETDICSDCKEHCISNWDKLEEQYEWQQEVIRDLEND